MKTRNLIFTFFALIVFAASLSAQEHKVSVSNPKETTLTLKDFYDELPIEGYAGNEIVITSMDDRFEAPAQAKGLKAIYAAGTDNTGMALNVDQNGNNITITCLLPITKGGAKYKLKVPESISLRIHSGCDRSNGVNIKDVKGEIEVNVCQSIKLKNVSGPLVLSTISGNIEIVYAELNNNNKPISIANISGEIDVTLPAKAAVNLEMKTISGNIYSDFDFNAGKKDLQRVGGGGIQTTLNGGGPDLKITNISGNIYLRKG